MMDTARICELYGSAIAAGEDATDVVGYLAASNSVQRPAIYKRLRSGGALPPYGVRRTTGRNAAGIRKERKDIILTAPAPVNRDPCPRCGVRRDHGCEHSHVRLGMVL